MMNNRFNSILLDIQDDEIISLPICDDNTEFIFTYHLIKNEDGSFCLEEIVNIFSHEKTSNFVKKLNLEKILKESNISFEKSFFVKTDGLKSLLLHKQYMELYEDYYRNSQNCRSESNCEIMHDELINLFEQIVPPSPLKDFYYFLAKDFFRRKDSKIATQ